MSKSTGIPKPIKQLAFLILFTFIQGFVRSLITFVGFIQWGIMTFTGKPQQELLRFSIVLVSYADQLARYITFNLSKKPFPFDDLPQLPK